MARDEKRILEIVGVYLEEDKTWRQKHWLWLKVRSDVEIPVEVRARASGKGGRVMFDRSSGCAVDELSLGFHALEGGMNELPPLPIKMALEKREALTLNIIVRSIRDPLIYHEVTEPVYFFPCILPGGKCLDDNLIK